MMQHLLHRHLRAALSLSFLMTVGAIAVAADDESDSASDADPKPVEVTGTFESTRSFEISARNDHLTDLKIQRIVPYGSEVSEGQTVVWFETEKLDEKIEQAEHDLAIAKLTMESDEFAYQQFLKTQELDRDKAKRDRDIARQAFDNYKSVDRDRQIKSANFSLRSSEFSLESATEEYRQLEQMYKEDDLTEESEEIVLRRAKRAMESAAFSLERARIETDRTIKQTVPRGDASQEETLARANLTYDREMQRIANEKQKRALEIQKKRADFKEKMKSFEEMRAERKQIVLQSPIEGLFVYGKLDRAKLPAKPVVWNSDSSVAAKQVIGTVLDPRRLRVRIDLPEEHLHAVSKGARCKVTPKGLPELELGGAVQSVSGVAFVPGKYDCVVSIKSNNQGSLMPGMSCKVTIDPPAKEGQ